MHSKRYEKMWYFLVMTFNCYPWQNQQFWCLERVQAVLHNNISVISLFDETISEWNVLTNFAFSLIHASSKPQETVSNNEESKV